MEFDAINGIGIINTNGNQAPHETLQSPGIWNLRENNSFYIYGCTDTDDPSTVKFFDEKFNRKIPVAAMRNRICDVFSISGIKRCFLITTGCIVPDVSVFSSCLNTAQKMGSWVQFGRKPGSDFFVVNDDDDGSEITISKTLPNFHFLFLNTSLLEHIGGFNEMFTTHPHLDLLEFLEKCRLARLYPPHPYHIVTSLDIPFETDPDYRERYDQKLYAEDEKFFYSLNPLVDPLKYNQRPQASENQLLEFLGTMKKHYSFKPKKTD